MNDIPDVPTIEKGIYEHHAGKRYEVLGVAMHTESLEPMVVYRPLYDSPCEFWVRPYVMFFEHIEKDGQRILRFKKVD